ncbi:MAG: HAMP domain-containing histidine kinase, partial [Desulfobulbaceae bacterium]|nr:HAMP domain-containing histidine kinase [Desulfobulbaceae bacterium]
QRIEEERILQQITQLNLTEILDRTIDLMTTMAEDKDITLKTHVIKDLPLIIGDKNGIEAIFVNLIGNAVKYTPDGGQVMVDIHKSGQDVRIKVVDTGIGIAQSDIKRIFEKFYRIKSESTSQIAGSGLGLSIVKRVVDLHKGSIHVHSEQDKGTTFIVTLPMAQ